jgi:hypothetical protein
VPELKVWILIQDKAARFFLATGEAALRQGSKNSENAVLD